MDFIKDHQIAQIFSAKLAGEITVEQQEMLDEWVERSPKHRALYEELLGGEGCREYEQMVAGLNPDGCLEGIDRKIRQHRRRRVIVRVASAAAVLLVGVMATVLLFRGGTDELDLAVPERPQVILSWGGDGRQVILTQEEQGTKWQQHIEGDEAVSDLKITVPTGGEYHLILSDGTAVWLNAGTVFEYPVTFTGEQRAVSLVGEAYFKVAREESMPFVVSAPDDVRITVLGTSFNLSAYENDRTAVATLVSGAVEVCSATSCVELTPGQQAVIGKEDGEIAVGVVDTQQYISWTQGIFEFDTMSLEEVAARLSRWYGVKFIFEEGSGQKYFTGGTWKYVPLKEFLERIEMVTNVSFRYDGDTVIVSSR